jgi:uncharacterized ferritin-like protein (DUF455 family)
MSRQTVHDAACQALMATELAEKQSLLDTLSRAWDADELLANPELGVAGPVPRPGRPERPLLVHPRELKQRKLFSPGGHAAFLHALAHIEFNAINLALDAVYRFHGLPGAFYSGWIQVAREEVYHHQLLVEHLENQGYGYGDFPAHNGLWDMAMRTDSDLLLRMALIPRVFEARGLDVTPPMIERLRQYGDERGAEILEIILHDEVGHVAIGNRWYHWVCERRGLEPQETFIQLVREYLPGRVKGPFHVEARLKAGFSEQELRQLENLEY